VTVGDLVGWGWVNTVVMGEIVRWELVSMVVVVELVVGKLVRLGWVDVVLCELQGGGVFQLVVVSWWLFNMVVGVGELS